MNIQEDNEKLIKDSRIMSKIIVIVIIWSMLMITTGQLIANAQSIDGLLHEIKTSEYTFIRNGYSYTGEQAYKWLSWKRYHRQYKNNPIKTEQEFIARVANRSRRTGTPYYIIVNKKYIRLDKWLTELETHNTVEGGI